jgi:hypothetical protein
MPIKKENRSAISKAQSYLEIGKFWDTHDLTDYLDKTRPAQFEVDIQSEVVQVYFFRSIVDKIKHPPEAASPG